MNERPLRGIALMTAATMCFSLSDAMTKMLVVRLPAIEVAWIRYVIFVLIVATGMLARRDMMPTTRRPGIHVLRGLGIVGSSVFFVFGLSFLPLGQAAAISFASPLFIAVLAAPFLGERVGAVGWSIVAAGFAGVLIVIRPGFGSFQPAALLVLLSSLAWAFAMITTRRMVATERPATILLWTSATGCAVLTLLVPFSFIPITLGEFALTVLMSIAATAGQMLAVLAYREATASVLAPLSYCQLVWSTSLGYLVFASVPDLWTLVGAVLIVASGLSTVQRERLRMRRGRALAAGDQA